VLSGEDEARLGFEAVAYDPFFGQFDRVSIIDPGGHSTELMTATREGDTWQTEFAKSFPVGTLGLKSQVLTEESPGPMQILEATRVIDDMLDLAQPPREPGVVVVLGATGTNLVSIREALETWQPDKVHGAYLLFEEISRSAGWMMAMTDGQRRDIVGMEPGRERTLHVGALILERFLHALRSEGCYVSVRGWRYALLERELP
jgi:exopolyphosphatase/guanosine-5'-triphosphate,3'-diphosphate pyrophosphatase